MMEWYYWEKTIKIQAYRKNFGFSCFWCIQYTYSSYIQFFKLSKWIFIKDTTNDKVLQWQYLPISVTWWVKLPDLQYCKKPWEYRVQARLPEKKFLFSNWYKLGEQVKLGTSDSEITRCRSCRSTQNTVFIWASNLTYVNTYR